MNWLAAIGVGLCSAPVSALIMGTAAGLWAEWLRVPQREGAAGYFAFGIALLAAILSLVLGIAFARGWLISAPGFWKALGTTVGACSTVGLAITALVWLSADLKPRIDGRRIELAVELRYPSVGSRDPPDVIRGAYVTVMRLSDGDSFGYGSFDPDRAREADGYIVSTILPLETSAPRKALNVHFGSVRSLMFPLEFGAKPASADFEWSRWIDAAQAEGEPVQCAGERFALRYRARIVEPPPPPPTQAEAEAAADARQDAAMRALPADGPLAQWLEYTRYGVPQARIDFAAAAIRARPAFAAEMIREMLRGEHEASRDALRAIEHIKPPPTELADTIRRVGDEIARSIRELPAGDDQSSAHADISTRFSAWMVATRALQGVEGNDFVPQLQAIIEPARTRQDSYVLQMDVVRVASYYLKEWAGIEPLPSDPPPR